MHISRKGLRSTMANQTVVTEFFLQGLTDTKELQVAVFLLLLLAYLVTVSGNLTIISLTLLDTRLQTPMYLFLRNLSCLEIWFQTVIVPKMLLNIATGTKTISFAGCITQDFFHIFLGATEFFLLTAMAYDRYIAICKPLHYPVLISSRVCPELILTCWLLGFSFIIVPVVLTSQLPFCDTHINHFFCDYTSLMEVVCSGPKVLEMVDFTLALVALLGTLVLITLSYVRSSGRLSESPLSRRGRRLSPPVPLMSLWLPCVMAAASLCMSSPLQERGLMSTRECL